MFWLHIYPLTPLYRWLREFIQYSRQATEPLKRVVEESVLAKILTQAQSREIINPVQIAKVIKTNSSNDVESAKAASVSQSEYFTQQRPFSCLIQML